MKLPYLYEELIKKDQDLATGVFASIPNFEKWINNSTLPFFPEYTRHDLQHIEEVLTTSHGLIHDDAEKLVTPGDATVLVLASLLHDCAMHLTEDGFFTLIKDSDTWLPIEPFDSCSWYDLWEDFMATARRFDGRKLNALFGDSEPISSPNIEEKNLSDRDKLLIGEFIRRNHTRLAHEIAVYGLPGVDGKTIPLLSNIETKIADLSGLVARSHGMPLRECFEYLNDKLHLRDFNGIHAVYLMVLLRIADYLQIQPARAPKEVLEVRKLKSPISQGEWMVHHSVTNITQAGDDPEAISIFAEPLEAKIYIRVKEWIQGIQRELDDSWAVLGEVYGRFTQEDLNHLGLRLRRVKSNLDDWKEFAENVNYVPAKVSFESANPDLLKLLVGPLYDEKPEVGIRELLQNSVDAVRELEEHLKHYPEHKNVKRISQEEDVLITIELESGEPEWVCIRDKGIGMSLDIVQNYFLKAGASFRKSDAWKKEFEDEEGHSQVLRSGRFGVGALAGFLIGDKMYIKTRHISEPEDRGLKFEAGLVDEMINLEWAPFPIGTEIKIKVSRDKKEGVKELIANKKEEYAWYYQDKPEWKWDWYCLDKPVVKRKLFPGKKVLSQTNSVPLENSVPERSWRTFCPADFKKIHWSYKEGPNLVCNGLIISSSTTSGYCSNLDFKNTRYEHELNFPRLSIFDPDGKLPLNLQRTNLVRKLSFVDELGECVLDDFIAYALARGPGKALQTDIAVKAFSRFPGNLTKHGSNDFDPWISGGKGFCLNDPFLFEESGFNSLLFLSKDIAMEGIKLPKIPSTMGILRFEPGLNVYPLESWLGVVLRNRRGGYLMNPLEELDVLGRRVLLSKYIINTTLKLKSISNVIKRILVESEREHEDDHWVLLKVGNCPSQAEFNFEELISQLSENYKPDVPYIVAECALAENKVLDAPNSIIADHWLKKLGNALMPYKKADRRKKFPEAFESLKEYIKLHENE